MKVQLFDLTGPASNWHQRRRLRASDLLAHKQSQKRLPQHILYRT